MDYLSTVSGGGYIGTTLTIGMSSHNVFPFGRLDQENRETPEVRHLRDNSRYLVQNGLPSVISAIAIYLRGIMMNILVILPILLCAAAALVWLNPDTKELTIHRFLWLDLTGVFGESRLPFTILTLLVVAGLLIVYAMLVSVMRIKPLAERRKSARLAASIFVLALVAIFLEVHAALLELVFESQQLIKTAGAGAAGKGSFFGFFEFIFNNGKAFVLYISPFVLLVLPFIKGLITKATTTQSTSWGDFARKLASRGLLLFAAAVVPLLLWLGMMQLAYWGTEISQCPGTDKVLSCAREQIVNGGWPHAPAFLAGYFAKTAYYHGAFLSFVMAAAILFLFWFFLSVNSNSLHQLYRDRLGSAFLIKRENAAGTGDEIAYADDFELTAIDPSRTPYHLLNTALNVPGSTFANRRGRNADFFVFSQGYIGSEATGYVDTKSAEDVVDGLNIGTAMAISGAAAAPNMGMASIRPLSPTIALLNVRLGRWVRHPRDIAHRATRLEAKRAKSAAKAGAPAGEAQLRRIPGPIHLLYEAFSKTGVSVERLDAKTLHERSGFVFLTDGGHIDNLGMYELLRRRCKLIIVIDGEADPDFHSGSLVQVERFARIDLNVIVRMNWEPIGARTRGVAAEISNNQLTIEAGPHVALGSISYPPLAPGGDREKGALVYIKASLSGDESDYILAYKRANPAFPHETTLEQLFSEEQFEAYRGLGEHIARRFLDGRDGVAAYSDEKDELLAIVRAMLPASTLT
ncbi:hypothetical protein [Afipia sp. GAS231]|uniref:hypothetical protein n=1 Tax=Afipia sp. GAS231 TaxID=1882747 RepID=UPI0012FB8969|nr:hypothetical protein [Afipia sp. GAS231]